jgi:hypothetical protein
MEGMDQRSLKFRLDYHIDIAGLAPGSSIPPDRGARLRDSSPFSASAAAFILAYSLQGGMGSVMAKSRQPRQHAWTEDEVRRLKALAKKKMSAARVARALNRTLDSTKKKASRLSIPLGSAKRPWTAADLRTLRALAKKKRPLTYIARSLRRTVSATEKVASVHHISLDLRR